MQEHITWLQFLYVYKILPKWIPDIVPVTWVAILCICVPVIVASKNLKVRNPGKFQVALEFIVNALDAFVTNIVGQKEAKTLTPIIGTFFIFILTLNLFGLIPGMKSPTANINTTVALSLIAFVIVQYFSITRVGVVNYVKHFLGDPLWLAPLMLPIHIIGELARPLSLSIRLFGNIFGEDMVIVILAYIMMEVFKVAWAPAQFPMMLFAIFTSFVQALVFSMLVSIYIAVGITHEEHH